MFFVVDKAVRRLTFPCSRQFYWSIYWLSKNRNETKYWNKQLNRAEVCVFHFQLRGMYVWQIHLFGLHLNGCCISTTQHAPSLLQANTILWHLSQCHNIFIDYFALNHWGLKSPQWFNVFMCDTYKVGADPTNTQIIMGLLQFSFLS